MTSKTIFIKPVGNCCNLNCEYCYEQNEHYSKIDGNNLTVENTINYLQKYVNYDHVFIVFHGGEPLLAGESYYENILTYINKNFTGKYNIQIQTNGTLITDKLISLLKKHNENVSLSISIDPSGIKDLRYGDNSNTRNKVINNIKLLSQEINNTGIISVMHRYNSNSFINFVEYIINNGIKNLTINKCRHSNNKSYGLSELEYSEHLIKIASYWIKNRLYRKIHIQPLNALMSEDNKICLYKKDENKCSYFHVLEPPNISYEHCYHTCSSKHIINAKCQLCSILDFCGGGCPAESIDEDFCNGRRMLYNFIGGLYNENKKPLPK